MQPDLPPACRQNNFISGTKSTSQHFAFIRDFQTNSVVNVHANVDFKTV